METHSPYERPISHPLAGQAVPPQGWTEVRDETSKEGEPSLTAESQKQHRTDSEKPLFSSIFHSHTPSYSLNLSRSMSSSLPPFHSHTMLCFCFKLSPFPPQLTRVLPRATEQNLFLSPPLTLLFPYIPSLLCDLFPLAGALPSMPRKTSQQREKLEPVLTKSFQAKIPRPVPSHRTSLPRWKMKGDREARTNASPINPRSLPNREVTFSRRKRAKHLAVWI